MKPYIFLGPTLSHGLARKHLDATFLPPAAQGDVLRLLPDPPAVIGIIDGAFQFVPALWHKEILAAMEEGVRVYGAASIGALRAAELEAFGMRGVGQVFRMFRAGTCDEDDEVAVTFASAELGYRALSEAMIDIRDVCDAAARRRRISVEDAATISGVAKRLYFPDRTWDRIEQHAMLAGIHRDTMRRLNEFRATYGPTLKQRDAIDLLRTIGSRSERTRRRTAVHVERTIFLARSRDEVTRETVADIETPPGGAVDVARKKVLLGVLASKESVRIGLAPTEDEVEGVASWFREQYGLADDRVFDRWLRRNDLRDGGFDRGMRRFAAVVRMEEATRLQLESETDDYLRLYRAATIHADGEPRWVQVNVALDRRRGAVHANARTVFRHLSRAMPRLRRRGRLRRFHFVRKPPDIRLRFEAAEPEERLVPLLNDMLSGLVRRRCVQSVSRSVYEPESRVLGGPRASAAAHDYFHADSMNWILWDAIPRSQRTTATELLSGAILNDLFLAAVGCGSEVWDVWCNLHELAGPTGQVFEHHVAGPVTIAQLLRRASPPERMVLRRYRPANRRLATRLQQIRDDGALAKGLRSLLPFVAMFHCNRFGIDGVGQATLAKAMMDAWNPTRTFARE